MMIKLRSLLMQSFGLVLELGIIFLLVLIFTFVARYIIGKIHREIQTKKGDLLDETFKSRVLKPILVMIWIVGFAYMVYTFISQLNLQDKFQQSFIQFRNLIIIISSTWLCFEIKKQAQLSFLKKKAKSKKGLDKTKVEMLSKLGTMTLFLLSAMVILQTLGVNISTIIAFGGVGGLAIGFASKDVVANYFGGFMIHVTQPFKIGDWIYTPDQSLNGVVEHIGYYLTVVRGLDKRPFYVPNALFSSKMIINVSRMTNRRIKETIGIRYDDFDKINKIVPEIREMIHSHPDIDPNLYRMVYFHQYGPCSLDIQVYTFTKTKDWEEWMIIQQDIMIKIGEIITKHGAQMAFPTTTLDLPEELLKSSKK